MQPAAYPTPAISNRSISSRACQSCSRAKAKCVPQSDNPELGDNCARCFRLNKDCIFPPKSIRTRKKRIPNIAKGTAQLEQKIESLVTLLSATQGAVIPGGAPGQTPDEPRPQNNHQEGVQRSDHQPAFSWLTSPPKKIQPSWDAKLPSHCGKGSSVTSTPYPCTAPTSTLNSRSTPSIDIEVENADNLLKIYREYYEPQFPFIKIQANINAQELKARKPWLATTISMVASHENRARQLEMSKQIIMEITSALFLRCEKSLDMLEGLIIYNVWHLYYAPINPQCQSAALMQLAIAVLFDLGLNKPLRENDGMDLMVEPFRLAIDNKKEVWRSPEERRAYLCCFIITSTVSCSMKRIDGLDHTSYLDHTCQSLTEAAEFESDLILAFVARSQSLIASMSRILLSGGFGSDDVKAPISMHANSVKADLQKIFMALPPHLQENSLVRSCYHFNEVFIHEPSLHRSLFPSNFNSHRLDMLYGCLISAKSFLDIFYALPRISYYGFSIITLSQLAYSLLIVFKLSFIEVPGWDLAQIRSTVNLSHYFEHFMTNFEQVGAQIDSSQPTPTKIAFCTGCSRAMGRTKGWYDIRLAAETEAKQQEEQRDLTSLEDVFNGDDFNYWDQAFFQGDWEEIMGDYAQQ